MKGPAKHLPGLMVTFILAVTLGQVGSSRLVYGQAVNGTLLGTITDTNNAVVPGATVTITDVNTNVNRSATTNDSGNYVFGNLSQGTYRVEVERAGFKKIAEMEVGVQVNTTVRRDLQLEPGSVSEQVTVAAQEAPLQTDRADTGRLIEAKQVAE